MKYGIREICNVVLRAKDTMTLGTKKFYKGEPVLYFDTLKTSSFEGSSTTVYAQGGRGNARLMSWDGEKTTTFTMEDALISPEGLMILTGAGLIAPTEAKPIVQHITETIDITNADVYTISGKGCEVYVRNAPKKDDANDSVYVMLVKDGEIISEPYIGTIASGEGASKEITDSTGNKVTVYKVTVADITAGNRFDEKTAYSVANAFTEADFDSVVVDYYTALTAKGVTQVNITPDSFGSSFYLEADTLFRNEKGIDVPAEFIIPNCRVQSNFSFSMASSGDPSTFTFTLDCFPDYTRWDKSTKVLAAIQVIPQSATAGAIREKTDANSATDYEPKG